MRLLALKSVGGVGAFVMDQVCREMFAGGEWFGKAVFSISMISSMGLRLACRVNLDGVRDVLGVVLVTFNGACRFLNLSISGLLHCVR